MGAAFHREDQGEGSGAGGNVMVTDIVVPAEQEGTKAVLKAWLKKRGDSVRMHEPIVEIETDKVAVEIAATAAGVLSEILIEEGVDVAPGCVLGRIAEAGAATGTAKAGTDSASRASATVQAARGAVSQLSPGIRRLLTEQGLKAEDVPHGERLTREDIEAEIARRTKKTPAVAGAKVIPHDLMRRRIAEHMAQSMQTAPHVTALFEADFSSIIAHRGAHKAEFTRAGG